MSHGYSRYDRPLANQYDLLTLANAKPRLMVAISRLINQFNTGNTTSSSINMALDVDGMVKRMNETFPYGKVSLVDGTGRWTIEFSSPEEYTAFVLYWS